MSDYMQIRRWILDLLEECGSADVTAIQNYVGCSSSRIKRVLGVMIDFSLIKYDDETETYANA